MPEYNTIPVTVVHRDGGYVFKTNFNLNEIPVVGLTINLQSLLCVYDGTLSNVSVLATYKDGSTRDITNICDFITPQQVSDKGAVSGIIKTKAENFTIPAGYHNGLGTVGIDAAEQAKIIPENIKNGVKILGVSGTGQIQTLTKITPNGVDITHYWMPRTASNLYLTITYESKTNTRSDEYIVEAGKNYLARFIAPYGVWCKTAISKSSIINNTASVTGCTMIAPFGHHGDIFFTAPINGYLIMYKDDTATDGFLTECYEIN